MATGGERGQVDTEDRIMGRIAAATEWAEKNRQLAILAGLAIFAIGAGAVIYLNYRADLAERAAVRLDELRIASQRAAPEELRSELSSYIDQFGATPQGDEARLLLAEMELQRGDADAAIRLVEPVVDPDDEPLGYNAAWMLAIAEEQRGDLAAAADWYERLANAAPHEFQRRRARAARARIHTYAGEYDEAEAIYAELAAAEGAGEETELYAVKLGEVRARAAADLPPPSLPAADRTRSATESSAEPADPTPETPAEEEASEEEALEDTAATAE